MHEEGAAVKSSLCAPQPALRKDEKSALFKPRHFLYNEKYPRSLLAAKGGFPCHSNARQLVVGQSRHRAVVLQIHRTHAAPQRHPA